jgi:hypothetical protein
MPEFFSKKNHRWPWWEREIVSRDGLPAFASVSATRRMHHSDEIGLVVECSSIELRLLVDDDDHQCPPFPAGYFGRQV